MKWLFIAIGALLAWYLYEQYQNSGDSASNSPGSSTIPKLVAPVVTDTACIGKTDAQGNWYGIDISGNCTVDALGGSGGSW